jgi:hypothetical protein
MTLEETIKLLEGRTIVKVAHGIHMDLPDEGLYYLTLTLDNGVTIEPGADDDGCMFMWLELPEGGKK